MTAIELDVIALEISMFWMASLTQLSQSSDRFGGINTSTSPNIVIFKMAQFEILRLHKRILRFFGLLSDEGTTSLTGLLKNLLTCLLIIGLSIGTLVNCIKNIRNLLKLTDALYASLVSWSHLTFYLMIAVRKDRLLFVLNRLQDLMNESAFDLNWNFQIGVKLSIVSGIRLDEGSDVVRKKFVETEAKVEYFMRKALQFFGVSLAGCFYIPLLIPGYHYLAGTYSPSNWVMPFAMT